MRDGSFVTVATWSLYAGLAVAQLPNDPRLARLPQIGDLPRASAPSRPNEEMPPNSPAIRAPATVPPATVQPTGIPKATVPFDERDIAQFAARSIEFRVPSGWSATEVPNGREVRLVLVPPGGDVRRGTPHDGIWLSYHVRPRGNATEDLAAFLPHRVRILGAARALSTPESLRLSGFPAVRQLLETVDAPDGSVGGTNLVRRSNYLLARTDWAFVEACVTSPATTFDDRQATFDRLLQELRLTAPQLSWTSVAVVPGVQPAAGILGSWKAFRSRLWLGPDARLVMRQDNAQPAPLDAPTTRRPLIAGRYEARDDVLFVTWDDGTKLNIRWKFDGENLLLTDHEGQTTSLRRLFD